MRILYENYFSSQLIKGIQKSVTLYITVIMRISQIYNIVLVLRFQSLMLFYTNKKQGSLRSCILHVQRHEEMKMCLDVLSTTAAPIVKPILHTSQISMGYCYPYFLDLSLQHQDQYGLPAYTSLILQLTFSVHLALIPFLQVVP